MFWAALGAIFVVCNGHELWWDNGGALGLRGSRHGDADVFSLYATIHFIIYGAHFECITKLLKDLKPVGK